MIVLLFAILFIKLKSNVFREEICCYFDCRFVAPPPLNKIVSNYRIVSTHPMESVVSEIKISEYYRIKPSWYQDPLTTHNLDRKVQVDYNIEWLNCTYLVLRDTCVNRNFGLIYENQFIVYPGQLGRDAGSGTIVGIYENVIALGHWYSECFGHWIYDTLVPLMVIPVEVRMSSHIIACQNRKLAKETLMILGFTEEQIIYIKSREMVFGYQVHTVINPTTHLAHWSTALVNLSELLRKRLNLSSNPPTKYVLMNRNLGMTRHIKNFADFVNEVKNQLPQYPWEIFPDPFPSVAESAHQWNNVRVIFSPTGSNIVNMIFMRAGSAICVAMGDKVPWPELAHAHIKSIHISGFSIIGMKHFNQQSNPASIQIEAGIVALKRAIFAQEHGYFE